MKDRYLSNIKAILVITICAISLCAYAQIPAFNRISTCNYSFHGPTSPTGTDTYTYHYDPLNPALLISQTNAYADEHTQQNQEINCDSSYEVEDGGIRILTEYSPYMWHSTTWVSNLIDQSGRVIHHKKTTVRNGSDEVYISKEVYRHYNSLGFADSIYVHINNIGTAWAASTYYCKKYFDGNTLSHTIVYQDNAGLWEPFQKFDFSYPQSPVILTGFIRHDAIDSQHHGINTYNNEFACNPKVIPQSISLFKWSNNGDWVPTTDLSFSQFLEDGLVVILKSREPSESGVCGSDRIRFTLSGYPQDIASTSSYEGNVTEVVFTWRDPVADEDHHIPAPQDPISLYPNPFSSILNIAIEDKKGPAGISIFNMRGQLIRSWHDSDSYNLQWDGKDAQGFSSPRGIYLIKLRLGKESFVRKVLRN